MKADWMTYWGSSHSWNRYQGLLRLFICWLKNDVFIFFYNTLNNPSFLADKVACVTKYFDDVFHKCLILSHNKDLLKGDYLIDDRLKHGADTFDGERIQFYSKHSPD